MDMPSVPRGSTLSVLAASRSLLAAGQAKAKDWGGGVWRTSDDGEKIFISGSGEARGGGPGGPVLGTKRKPPAKKKPSAKVGPSGKKPEPVTVKKPASKPAPAIPAARPEARRRKVSNPAAGKPKPQAAKEAKPKAAKPIWMPSPEVAEAMDKSQSKWLEQHAKASGTTAEKLKADWTSEVQEMVAKAKVYIRMPPEVLDSVLTEGRYKSQFETNSSYGGDVQVDSRRGFEYHQMGVPKDIPDQERPVYGYASDREPHRQSKSPTGDWILPQGNHDSTSGYGQVVVEYKDSIKDRSTITFGDSMNSAEETLPTPMRSPDYRSLSFAVWGDEAPETPNEIKMGSVEGSATKEDYSYAEVQIQRGASAKEIAKAWFPKTPNAKTQSLLEQRGILWEVMK